MAFCYPCHDGLKWFFSVPVVCVMYWVMSWIKGVKLTRDNLPDDPTDMVLPAKYLVCAVFCFGVCQLMASISCTQNQVGHTIGGGAFVYW